MAVRVDAWPAKQGLRFLGSGYTFTWESFGHICFEYGDNGRRLCTGWQPIKTQRQAWEIPRVVVNSKERFARVEFGTAVVGVAVVVRLDKVKELPLPW